MPRPTASPVSTTPLAPAIPRDELARLLARAAQRGQRPAALVSDERALSYRQLFARAAQLSRRLEEVGVRPGDLVALFTDDPLTGLAGILGSLGAGAGYVPIDRSLPPEAVARILADCAPRAILACADSARCLDPGSLPVLVPSTETRERAGAPRLRAPRADDPAYVIYTSGTQGAPKGVVVTRASLAVQVRARLRRYPLRPACLLLAPPLAFDASVGGLFWTLAVGGRLILPTPSERQSPAALAHLIKRYGATHTLLVASLYGALLSDAAPGSLDSLRAVVVGGEVCPPSLLRRHWAALPGCAIYNEYGPTEATVCATTYAVPHGEAPDPVPIGTPLPGATCHILDEQGAPVAAGTAGELYVGGTGVARGYLGDTALTASRFVPDPFRDSPGARLFRTGDRARRRPDGELLFLGRLDSQVSLRGRRIEPGEVESAILDCGAREACVLLREDLPGGAALVGYYSHDALPPHSLRSSLAERLPLALIPAHLIRSKALPRGATGKLNPKALPDPERPRHMPIPHSAGPTAFAIAEVWEQLFETSCVGADDDFFALGGHSLLAAQAASRLSEQLGREVSIQAIFAAPRLSDLVRTLDATTHVEAHEATQPEAPGGAAPPGLPGNLVPLAPAQELFWLQARLEPNASYVEPLALRLDGPLDPEALERALANVVARHGALRMTCEEAGGRPALRVHDALRVPLVRSDLRQPGPSTGAQAALEGTIAAAIQRPFDLAQGPLVRVALVALAPEAHVLLVTAHHLVVDHDALEVFAHELLVAYGARNDPTLTISPPPVQYPDYAAGAQADLRGPRGALLRGFWRARLRDAPPPLRLPVVCGPGVPEPCRVTRPIAPDELARLRATAHAEGATPFMFVLAAMALVLQRWTGVEELILGVPASLRWRPELAQVLGSFVNPVPVRLAPEPTGSFRDLLTQVRGRMLEALAHADLPFPRLVADLDTVRAASGENPLFRVLVNHIDQRRPLPAIAGLRSTRVPCALPLPTLDLTVYVLEQPQALSLVLVHDGLRVPPALANQLADQIASVLTQVAASPARPLRELSLATPHATSRLPDPTCLLDPTGGASTLFEVVATTARHSPGRVAIVDPQRSWTYAELMARSLGVAASLRAQGVTPGDRVAIYAHRSAALGPALLGVLAARGVFALLDPAHPPGQLVRALEVLRPRAFLALTAAGPPTIELERALEAVPFRLDVPPAPPMGAGSGRVGGAPDDAAYVAFTSGSTGRPHAVLGAHRPVVHFLEWYARAAALEPEDRVPLLAGLGHDPLLRDLFAAWSVGGSVRVPAPSALRDPIALAAWLSAEQVSVAHVTPGLAQLIAAGGGSLPELRWVACGGDALNVEAARALAAVAPNARCWNVYGATETPQAVCWAELGRAPDSPASSPPVGRGIDDVQVLVLAPGDRPAGVAELGEVCVRTPYLAQEYLHDPLRTAERFALSPAATGPHDRMYRTGDLGRYDSTGAVVLAGRADREVSIRGHRVHLGEVEAALLRQPGVSGALVLADAEDARGVCLRAYVVRGSGPERLPDLTALMRALRRELPEWAVPARVGLLESWPLTPNGKLDVPRLPDAIGVGTATYVAPRDAREAHLVGLWAELLGVPRVGIHDDFFALGGHSLSAVRLLGRLEAELGQRVSVACLVEHPTPAELSVALSRAKVPPCASTAGHSARAPRGVVRLQRGDPQRTPLWIFHPVGGHVLYARRLAVLLGDQQPLLGIQAQGLEDDATPLTSVDAMAERSVRLIREVQGSGPYWLSGHSFGGYVALEVARRLRAAGHAVDLLVLFDTYGPGYPAKLSALSRLREARGPVLLRLLNWVRKHGLRLRGRLTPLYRLELARGDPAAPRIRRVLEANRAAALRYAPRPYGGDIVLVQATQRPPWTGMTFDAPANAWGSIARGALEVVPVDATHQDLFDPPAIDLVARALRSVLARTQTRRVDLP